MAIIIIIITAGWGVEPQPDDDDDVDVDTGLLFPAQCRQHNQTSRYDPLACWLQYLQLHIPDQSFHATVVTIQIRDLVCTNFTLEGLDSIYTPSNSSSNASTTTSWVGSSSSSFPEMNLIVQNISAHCQGSYHTTGGLSGHLTAEIKGGEDLFFENRKQNENDPNATITHALEWTLQILPYNITSNTTTTKTKSYPRPGTIRTSFCTTKLSLVNLSFQGSMSAKMADLFKHMIANFVTHEIQDQVCSILTKQVDPTLSHYLQLLNHWMDRYMIPVVPPLYEAHPSPPALLQPHQHDDRHQQKQQHLGPIQPQRYFEKSWRRAQSNNGNSSSSSLFQQAPLLVHVLSDINSFIEAHLDHGFLPTWVHPYIPLLAPWTITTANAALSVNNDSNTCGFFFNGINGIFQGLIAHHNHDGPDDDDNNYDNRDDNHTANNGWVHVRIPKRIERIHFIWQGYGAIELHIQNVTISGLDQWSRLHLLKPIIRTRSSDGENNNNTATDNSTGEQEDDDSYWETWLETPYRMRLVIAVRMVVTAIPGGIFTGDPLEEYFSFHLDTGYFSSQAHLTVETAVSDNSKGGNPFQHLTMSHVQKLIQGIMDGNHTAWSEQVSCLIQPIQVLQSYMWTTRINISDLFLVPRFRHVAAVMDGQQGQLEQDLDALLNNVLKLLVHEYQPLITDTVEGLVAGPARTALNRFLHKSLLNRTVACPSSSNQANPTDDDDDDDDMLLPHLVNFTRVRPLQKLDRFLSNYRTMERLNRYVDCVSSFLTWFVQEKLNRIMSNMWISNPLDDHNSSSSTPVLRLANLTIVHAGSVRELAVLKPSSDGMHLGMTLMYGTGGENNSTHDHNNEQPLSPPRLVAEVTLDYPPLNTSAVLDLVLVVDDLTIAGNSILLYESNRLARMSLSQVLQNGACLLSPIDDFALFDWESTLGLVKATLNVTIQAPFLIDDNHSSALIRLNLDSSDYPPVQLAVASVLDWWVKSFRDLINLSTRSSIDRAHETCEKRGSSSQHKRDNNKNQNDRDKGRQRTLLFTVAAVILFAQPMILFLNRPPDDDDDELLRTISDSLPPRRQTQELMEPLLRQNVYYDARQEEDNANASLAAGTTRSTVSSSLVQHEGIPVVSRILVPMLLIVTIAVLLASNLNVGASVDLVLSGDGDHKFQPPSLFQFSLFNTAYQMFQAGIYPLFFLVVVFSGVWPYVKLLLLLVAWIMPKQKLSTERRGQLLLALDALSKFSLVDTYVLVLMMVAFRYHLQFPVSASSSDTGTVALDVYVTPLFGFYGFLAATTASLVLGHVSVYHHRRTEFHIQPQQDELPPAVESLIGHAFCVDDGRTKLSSVFRCLLLTMLLVIVALLVVGITQESFTFQFGGLAGMALGAKRVSTYSVLSIGQSLPGSVQRHSIRGILILQLVYYFYAVVTPFACHFLLAILLLWPMTIESQLLVLTWAEIANAWSAIEVFVLSIVAALLEISTFASFILGHRCDLLDNILSHVIDRNDEDWSTCYTVDAEVSWNSIFLILAVVLNSAWVSLVLRLAHLAMRERLQSTSTSSFSSPSNQMPRRSLDQKMSLSLVEQCARSPWTRWMMDTRTGRVSVIVRTSLETPSPVGPPLVARGPHSPIPENIFSEEWEDAAERDPAWKEWKEATSVT